MMETCNRDIDIQRTCKHNPKKLRVIHLFEAYFKYIIGLLFGRRSMYQKIQHHNLHPGQTGKTGGECQDAALSKKLKYHISTYICNPLDRYKSVSVVCFNRIVMTFPLSFFFVWGSSETNLCTCAYTL